MSKSLFYIFLCLPLAHQVRALDLSKINFNYLYNGSFDIHHQLAVKSDTIHLYLRFKKHPDELKLLYQNNYQDTDHIEPPTFGSRTDSSRHGFTFQTKIKNSKMHNLIVVEFMKDGKKYYYDIPVNKGIELGYPDFVLSNSRDSIVFLKNYISKSQKLNTGTSTGNLVCYDYNRSFSAALPPMITRSPSGSKNLVLDSVFFFQKTLGIDTIGRLFFIQSDSSTNVGRGFISVPSYFPKFRLPEELIQPLVYIATKEEKERTIKAKNKKKAFDNFWIGRVKTKDRAKETIKRFYQNVTKANTYFTNYKEGWKTDPGMLYVVFGAPDEVERNEREEKWSYFRFGEKITFNFEKIPNLFVRRHLRLQRDKSHSKIWFREVSAWRKGRL